MRSLVKRAFVLVVGAIALVIFTLAFRPKRGVGTRVVYVTLGEVQVVHADVTVRGEVVTGVHRLGEGDVVATGDAGRARARLDDGTSVVLDRATSLRITPDGVTLDAGRLFVEGGGLGRMTFTLGPLTLLAGSSTLALDRTDAGGEVYCVTGETTLRAGGQEVRVRSGEIARLDGGKVSVLPSKVWNDWTGGMARPWGAGGKPRGSIGELWGRRSGAPDDPGTPLATRGHDVAVTIEGEVATTVTTTTYFNAGSAPVVGDFRMAIPDGAVVSGFALGTGAGLEEGRLGLASSGADGVPDAPRLEWAGEGWVRGTTRPIKPAETAVVVVRYVEWLAPAGGLLTYRYPMRGETIPSVIGEFHASIGIGGVDATAVGIGSDLVLSGDTIELRRADFRATSDLVVDFKLRPGAFAGARGYLVPGEDDTAGSFLLVRTEVDAVPRASTGATLSVIVDTSRSIDPGALDAARAVVESLLLGLGPRDRIVVFAADDRASPVGPDALGNVDDARRESIRRALGDLRPGGATDLGAALERGAAALPLDEPSGMVLYVGDGWPTLGEVDADAIRSRLERRPGGVPRLGAVAVGSRPNRLGLTALVREGGPVFAATDRGAAAEVTVELLAQALEPTVTGAEVDLGADVERVYPRGSRAVRAGDTMTTVGRVSGAAPRSVAVRYRDGRATKEERRPLTLLPVADEDDLRRRWGAARVVELMLRGGGPEAVVDAALKNELLTPWTGWAVGVDPPARYRETPLSARLLDSSPSGNLAVFSARFATPPPLAGALREPTDEPWPSPTAPGERDVWKAAAEASARRTLDEAIGPVRLCRESRAALRPEVGGALHVELALSGKGVVRTIHVRGLTSFDDDAAVDRCVEEVIRGATFYLADGPDLVVVYEFHLPASRDDRARTCSPTSTLPSPMRRGVWFERLGRPESAENPKGTHGERAYRRAKSGCELPTWTDRRAFLELLLDGTTSGPERVDLARSLDDGGDADAADFVRRETVRRASSPAELAAIRRALLATEPDVALPFVTSYAKVTDDERRLAVVRRFLKLAPHDARLRRRELALLEALGRRDELLAASSTIRQEPFLDAALLADTASMLRREDSPDESRRTFGELAERAPEIPFARAFLGDRLLDEGSFDEATVAYSALLRLVPDDPAASLRLALAHAGAGRIDLALRLLSHVTETGGRTSDASLQRLATITRAMLVAEARAAHPTPDEEARLARRAAALLATSEPGMVLVRAPTWVPGLRVVVSRGKADAGDALDVVRAPSLGLAGTRFERGERELHFKLSRQLELEPARSATAKVEVLVADGDAPRWVSKEVPLRLDGTPTEVSWDGTNLR